MVGPGMVPPEGAFSRVVPAEGEGSRSSHDRPSPRQQPAVGVAGCLSNRDRVGMGRRK